MSKVNISAERLKEILAKHLAWIRGEAGGERANLERANLERANLERANLEGAYLEGAYLEGAYLERANLRGAYLEGANLERANLRGANLRGANLEGANLRGAYLEGANLRGANLERAKIFDDIELTLCPLVLTGLRYTITIADDYMGIGCQRHRLSEWKNFEDDEIEEMDDDALEWWTEHKVHILALADFHQAQIEKAKDKANA